MTPFDAGCFQLREGGKIFVSPRYVMTITKTAETGYAEIQMATGLLYVVKGHPHKVARALRLSESYFGEDTEA